MPRTVARQAGHSTAKRFRWCRSQATVPKMAPIPAVTPIARAPQKVTRMTLDLRAEIAGHPHLADFRLAVLDDRDLQAVTVEDDRLGGNDERRCRARDHKPNGAVDPGLSGRPMRSSIWIGILIGSTIGGLIPGLWGDGMLSYSSVLLSGVGAFVGLWIGFKLSN